MSGLGMSKNLLSMVSNKIFVGNSCTCMCVVDEYNFKEIEVIWEYSCTY